MPTTKQPNSLARSKRPVNTWGPRRRFHGKTVLPSGACRASAKVSRPSKVTFECGQTKPYDTKHIPGQFKVEMPRNHIRHIQETR